MGNSIVFVDWRVADIDALIATLSDDSVVCLIDGSSDGLDQIVARLQGQSGIDAMHIISHGRSGSVYLGNSVLDAAALATHAGQLEFIGKSLTESGDILLYGCNVAAGDTGQAFIGQLAQATGADVAASVDLTGTSFFGGNVYLEVSRGDVATLGVLSQQKVNDLMVLLTSSVSDGFRHPLGSGYLTEDSTFSYLGIDEGYYTSTSGQEYHGFYSASDFNAEVWLTDHYSYHLGEDWNGSGGGNTDFGVPVYAISNGQVIYSAQQEDPGLGYYLVIQHDLAYPITVNGLTTSTIASLYAHLRQVPLVGVGDVVSIGQEIAQMGSTGYSETAHLHFEIRLGVGVGYQDPDGYNRDGAPAGWVDPTDFINQYRTLTSAPQLPDLEARKDEAYAAVLDASSVTQGATVTLTYRTSSWGPGTAAESITGIYLSNDGLFDSSDVLISTDAVPALTASAGSTESLAIDTSMIVPGAYHVFAVVDYNNVVSEANESNNASNAVSLTISPSVAAGSVSVNDVTITEGESGTSLATFTVTRTEGTAAFSIDYATNPGTATAGTDYVTAAGTLSFAANEQSTTVQVQVLGDTQIEGNEQFYLNLFSPTNGATIADGQGVAIILNDDVPVANKAPVLIGGDGKLTVAFGPGDDRVSSIAVQPDGKILAAGQSYNGSTYDFALVRYHADGILDTSFSFDGKVTTSFGPGYESFASGIALQPNGKILVAGGASFGSLAPYFALARYNVDGSLDTTFSGDGMLLTALGVGGGAGNSIALQGDDKIVVAGYRYSTDYDFALVRYNPDGSLDNTFSGDGILTTGFVGSSDVGNSVIVQPDEKIVVAGYSDTDSSYDFAVLRFNPDGTPDTTFSGDGRLTTDLGGSYDVGNSIVLQPDDKIVVAGYNSSVSSNYQKPALVRYNPDGTLDSSFSGDGMLTMDFWLTGWKYQFASSVALQPDRKIVVAASRTNDDYSESELARYDTDGNLDPSFGFGGRLHPVIDSISVALQSDAKIIVAGDSHNGSDFDFAVTRYNSNGSFDTSFGKMIVATTERQAFTYSLPVGRFVDPDAGDVLTYSAVKTDGSPLPGWMSIDPITGTLSGTPGDYDVGTLMVRITATDAGGLSVNDNLTLTVANVDYNTAGNDPPALGGGDGKLTTAIGASNARSITVALQSDGKILVAGYASNGSNDDFALVRYNPDGSLDNSFDGDGKVTTAIGASNDRGGIVALQSDGKILAAGYSSNGSNDDFALVRYKTDGSLDNSFDSDGKVTIDIGLSNDQGRSVTVQPDGMILVAGFSSNGSNDDFALVRYNPDGSLDNSFDSDGKVTIDIGLSNDQGRSVIVQADGRIVVAGYSSNGSSDDFALVRYKVDGSLDTSFDGDGKITTDFGGGNDRGQSVTVQADGKILVAGSSWNGSNDDFALVRYNVNGSLDTGFDGDGKLTTAIGSLHDTGLSVTIQPDLKILVAGISWNGGNYDFALARYNVDGSLDTSFDGDGKLTTAIGGSNDVGYSVTLQPDGRILVAGYSSNGSNEDFAVVRYNPDGSLDTSFDRPVLTATAAENEAFSYTLPAGRFVDPDTGDTLTYTATKSDGSALPGWLTINSATGAFSGTPGDNDIGNLNLRVIATDAGGLSASDTVTLTVANVYDAPALAVPPALTFTDTAANDSFIPASGTLVHSDIDAGTTLTYDITGGTSALGVATRVGTYGTLSVDQASGAWSFAPNDAAIEALKTSTSENFIVTVSDGAASASQTLTIHLVGANDAPVVTVPVANLTLLSGGVLVPYPGITLVDPDGTASIAGATITLVGASAGDFVAVNVGNTGIASHFAGGTLTLNGTGSLATYQDMLGTLALQASNPGARTLELRIDDGNGPGEASVIGVSVESLPLNTEPIGLRVVGDDQGNSLYGGAGNDTLLGLGGNDTILSGDGNDLLDGGRGADHMAGGNGNDLYVVDHRLDQITELAANGIDSVSAKVSHALADNVENLFLTGSVTLRSGGFFSRKTTTIDLNSNGTGNDSDNLLRGNRGHNALDGLGGNDTLLGGAGADLLRGGTGADKLVGGAGADIFVFAVGDGDASLAGADMLYDFEDGIDRIALGGGLTFNDLIFTPGNGMDTAASNMVIGTSGNEFLAILLNTNSSAITGVDFQLLGV